MILHLTLGALIALLFGIPAAIAGGVFAIAWDKRESIVSALWGRGA